MRIISWNCNGAFRKKSDHISILKADVYIIQECEDPSRSSDNEYKKWANNYLWSGGNKNRGIGIFAQNGIEIEALNIDSGILESFLPFIINKKIVAIAVWTKQANSPTFAYIGQFWKYLQNHKEFIKENKPIIIGDFNSNKIWDKWDRWWNHSDVVRELEEINIYSLYHSKLNEEQGKESVNTLYLHRNLEKFYHIDYVFLNKDYINKAKIEIGLPNEWLEYSDHMPLIMDIDV